MAKPKTSPKVIARRKLVRRGKKTLIWLGVLAVVGGIGYMLATSSNVRFDEHDIAVVDFTVLDAAQKKTALQNANAAQCTCGCSLRLAECVATDATCPIRTTNIDRIRAIVDQAKGL